MAVNITQSWYFIEAEKSLISKVSINEIDQWFIQENWLREDTPKFKEKWDLFKSEITTDNEVWSYKFGGPLSQRGGYAIVNNGKVKSCFQTMMS